MWMYVYMEAWAIEIEIEKSWLSPASDCISTRDSCKEW